MSEISGKRDVMDREYEKKRKLRLVSFNSEDQDDARIYNYSATVKPTFSEWVKYELDYDAIFSDPCYKNEITIGSFVKFTPHGLKMLTNADNLKTFSLEETAEMLAESELLADDEELNLDNYGTVHKPQPELVLLLNSVWVVKNIYIFHKQEIRVLIEHQGNLLKVHYSYIYSVEEDIDYNLDSTPSPSLSEKKC
jgi:hypothetical protein